MGMGRRGRVDPPDAHRHVVMWWLMEKWALNGFGVQTVPFRSVKLAPFEGQTSSVHSFSFISSVYLTSFAAPDQDQHPFHSCVPKLIFVVVFLIIELQRTSFFARAC